MARLEKEYNDNLKTKIQKELNLSNVMEVPKVTKITLNMGVGEAVADKKVLDKALKDMEQIAGNLIEILEKDFSRVFGSGKLIGKGQSNFSSNLSTVNI